MSAEQGIDRSVLPDNVSTKNLLDDYFTDQARQALSLAAEEALYFQHNYIGTEHILLGLLHEKDDIASKVLSDFGVELHKVRSAVEFIIGRGESMVRGKINLTPRTKKVIELAVDEARGLNHRHIGTEHLLVGLMREGQCIAAGILETYGTNLEKIRTQVFQISNQENGPEKRSNDQI